MIRFLESSQKDPTPEHRRKYSGKYPQLSFNHDSKYVIKNVPLPTQKQIQAFKVGKSDFRTLGKYLEWELIESLIMQKNTESSLKTIQNIALNNSWRGPLEKNTEKRPCIKYLKNENSMTETFFFRFQPKTEIGFL